MANPIDNWPAEEAQISAGEYLESVKEGCYIPGSAALQIALDKDRSHWTKVFGEDEQGLQDLALYADTFNALCFTTLLIKF